MRTTLHLVEVLLLLLAGVSTLSAATTELWGKAGENWTPASPLPDFSFAGYHMGADEPVTGGNRVNVKTFGAAGDGKTDDTAAVLKAIDKSAGKVIFFPAGKYIISGLIKITQSGTVLQGEGTERTTLLMPVPMNTIAPRTYARADSALTTTPYSWSGGIIALSGSGYAGEPLTEVTNSAKRGDAMLTVAKTSKLKRGTRVVLDLTDTSARTLLTYLYRGDSDDMSKLKPFSSQQVFTIVKAEGQTVALDRPLRADVNLEWAPRLKRYEPTLENCGVENLTIEFPATTTYRGHWLEDGYNPIEIKGAADCWLRNLKILNPDSGPFVVGSVFCTLDGIELTSRRNSAVDDITGHHGISLMGADCLCRDFTIGAKFFHDITLSEGSTGNVFSNGSAVDLAMDHHRHAPYENLFTQIDAGLGTRLWSSGGERALGKHTAAGAVFWNIKTKQTVAMPPADFAPNGGLVIAGMKMRPRKSEVGTNHFESLSPENLEPPNLYRAQNLRRLGSGARVIVDARQTWTSAAGTSIQASFVRIDGANVLLIKDGKTLTVPLQSLSPESVKKARALESQHSGR